MRTHLNQQEIQITLKLRSISWRSRVDLAAGLLVTESRARAIGNSRSTVALLAACPAWLQQQRAMARGGSRLRKQH